jgi:monoamine oxidase
VERYDHVVLALPPRVLAETVQFEPALPDEVTARWGATPTWMAGHAKFVARYSAPFWRDLGLSGMASSQVGPMVEIHDASPADAATGALFGFVGVPAAGRRALGRDGLVAGCVAQLERLFGAPAAYPVETSLMDWAEEPWTARGADRVGFGEHPEPQPATLPAPWTRSVLLAGSEFSSTIPGYLEGAVQAAETAVALLIS